MNYALIAPVLQPIAQITREIIMYYELKIMN